MDRTTNLLFYVTVVCFVCGPFTTNATFTINRKSYTKDDKCLVDFHVEGNGVDYTATAACADADNMQLRYTPSGLVLGDYRSNPLSVYTDTLGELLVIKNQVCYNVKRKAEGEVESKGKVTDENMVKSEGKVNGEDKVEGKDKGEDRGEDKGKGEDKDKGEDKKKIEGKDKGEEKGKEKDKGEGKGEDKVKDENKGEEKEKGEDKGEGKDESKSKSEGKGKGEDKGEGKEEYQVDKMLFADCAVAKQKVEEAWEIITHIGVIENNIAGVNLVRRRYVQHGTCMQEYHLKGNGSDTSLAMSCEQAEGMEMLHTPQGMVLGDHRKDDLCVVVSDATGLVIIQGSDKVCKKEFSSGEGEGGESVNKELCDEAKGTIETLWDKNQADITISRRIKYTKKNRCVEEFTFLGEGVDASIKVKCEVGQKLDILKFDEVFIIGDYRHSPICIFNNSPTSLLAIREEDGYKICREDVFGQEVSRRTLLPFDCATAKQFVKQRWDDATGSAEKSE